MKLPEINPTCSSCKPLFASIAEQQMQINAQATHLATQADRLAALGAKLERKLGKRLAPQIMSVIQTAKQQGRDALDFVRR